MSEPQDSEADLQALSEAQLRQLYDEEEVERSMSLFSAYVTEVRLASSIPNTESIEPHVLNIPDTATSRTLPAHPLPRRPTNPTLSEQVAHDYILPYLPPAMSAAPNFTLRRLSLTIQRLYLALYPPYHALLSNLTRLALWKDYQRSLRYCIMFWFLWFHDLLLPALIFRIVFGLLRRRLSNYPTLKELQERREESAQAVKFGEAVQQRLSATTLGPVEMWHLFKLYKSGGQATSSHLLETDEEENLLRDMLYALNELADLHERIKNVFTWRRPAVSRFYLIFLIVIAFGTLVIPARYVAKIVYWFGGVLFWHVTPVIAALPRADRSRVWFLFRNAPTDAEYAMELITKRIAAGQDIGTLRNQARHTSSAFASKESLTSTLDGASRETRVSDGADSINWKKWGGRVALGKSFVDEGRRLLSTNTSRNQILGEATVVERQRPGTEDTHTFLAQYSSFPGLITLTASTLFFTSLTGTHARLIIPRDRLRGVKKSGLMKGITISWAPEGLAERMEKEEKFHWVGDRDELFARLVGADGGRWMRV